MIELVIFISANVDVRVNQWQHFLKVSAAETQTKSQMKTLKVREIQKQWSRIACKKNSHSHMFFRIGVLKNFVIFTGKHMCWSHSLIKLLAFRPAESQAVTEVIHILVYHFVYFLKWLICLKKICLFSKVLERLIAFWNSSKVIRKITCYVKNARKFFR